MVKINAKDWYEQDPNDTYHISRQHNSIRIHCVFESQGDIFMISRIKEIKKLYEIAQEILFDTQI